MVSEDKSTKVRVDVTHTFSYVFWFGDLNYRIDMPRDVVISHVALKDWDKLFRHDQLHTEMKAGNVFYGFTEGRIKFAPTFKLARGEVGVWNKQKLRVPSWCDRILYRTHPNSSLEQIEYDSVPTITESDHRPVYSTFRVKMMLRPTTIPPFERMNLTISNFTIDGVTPAAGGGWHIQFHAPALLDPSESHVFISDGKETSHYVWDMTCVPTSLQYFQRKNLGFGITSAQKPDKGPPLTFQGVFSLRTCTPNESVSVDTTLICYGTYRGTATANLFLHVS
eukprot:GFYU01010983.1.p1 GENE.GFYU01010983.1~~GFYU01010983.1.p1  ORF type:complete len:306 (-),score=61.42 GFYU01010983.1:69-908(-)